MNFPPSFVKAARSWVVKAALINVVSLDVGKSQPDANREYHDESLHALSACTSDHAVYVTDAAVCLAKCLSLDFRGLTRR